RQLERRDRGGLVARARARGGRRPQEDALRDTDPGGPEPRLGADPGARRRRPRDRDLEAIPQPGRELSARMKLIGAGYAWNFRWSRAIRSFHRSASSALSLELDC